MHRLSLAFASEAVDVRVEHLAPAWRAADIPIRNLAEVRPAAKSRQHSCASFNQGPNNNKKSRHCDLLALRRCHRVEAVRQWYPNLLNRFSGFRCHLDMFTDHLLWWPDYS